MLLFLSDLKKYKRYSKKKYLLGAFINQGLWALFIYRVGNKVYRSKLPGFVKISLLSFYVLFQKALEIVIGISIPYSVNIGHSCYIGHFGNIILHPNVSLGNNCNLSQGVTIGVSGYGVNRGAPTIGNNVYIGANAVIVGNITIGDDILIGANSLVNRSFSQECTLLGVPAQAVKMSSRSKDLC